VVNPGPGSGYARDVAGLVLAAGGSSRYGSTKQLALYQGRSLVERAASAALRVCGAGCVVVTGAQGGAVGAAVSSLPVIVKHNPLWQSGLSTSLAAGVAAVPANASALLILLCDQPCIDSTDLDAIVGASHRCPNRVVAAQYGTVTGVPAIFPRKFWAALQTLRGDVGARALIATLDPVTVGVPHAAVDVDTPTDLERLNGRSGAASPEDAG
jgi:molybdenum cofactor cytidylyltransferase